MISVIIPTYNEEKVLSDCIESLGFQTYTDFEIIIVDDGSTDGTLEILKNLEKSLPPAAELLKPAGKLVIISFHSLEDRVVKNFFKQKGKEGNFKILTPKPIIASVEELKTNPRARSAKLRAIQRI